MKPSSKQFVVIGATVLVAILSIASFILARDLSNGRKRLEAQVEPADVIERINADKLKPDFEGSLNGFAFYDPASSPAVLPGPCIGLIGGGQEATGEEIESSPLNFSAGYIPQGLQAVFEGGNKCREQVVAIVRNYGIKSGPLMVVARVASEPAIPADAPAERMGARSIGGRPAVVTEPAYSGDRAVVYMRDELGYWMIAGIRVD